MSSWIDIKYALRLLMKKPVFTATSVLIVAIGLGLTLYTYSLLSQLIYKPLTLNGDSPLIAVKGQFQGLHGWGQRVDSYHLKQVSAESELLEGMSLYRKAFFTVNDIDNTVTPIKVGAVFIEWNIFELTGVQPILGRGLSPDDQEVGAEPVAVLGYKVWKNTFGGDKDIINTSVKIEGVPTRVIGVMPEGFAFPQTAQIWRPLRGERVNPTQPSGFYGHQHASVARLKPNASLSEFQQELKAILQKNLQNLPQDLAWRATTPGGYMRAFPFKLTNNEVYYHYSIFIAMLTVVLLILLLTGINIGNLLLVRVNERMKEVAIRISLGVPRKRLVLQMLWESIFICSLGGLLAFFLAQWGASITNDVFEQIFAVSGQKPFWWQLSLDMDAIWVLLAVIVLMIIVTGFIPAWRALSGDLNSVLRDGTRGALGKKAGRANLILLVAEIGLSCVVLVVATMLLSTSYSAQDSDYGTDIQNRLTAEVLLPYGTYPWSQGAPEARKKRNDVYYRLKDDLEQLVNINGVAYFSNLPGTGSGGGAGYFEIQGKGAEVYNENPYWNYEVVSRDAWHAVGMKLIEGRNFDPRDSSDDSRDLEESPVIINAAMATELFPEGDAIGQRVRSVWEGDHSGWRTIIGIVSDTVHGSTMQATSSSHNAYGLMDLNYFPYKKIVVHYSGSPSQAEKALIDAVKKIDPNITVASIQSYEDLIKQPFITVNTVNTIFLYCGLVALFLAASGIYAVAANSITLRSQEIATRRALGARNNQVISMFLKKAGMQLVFGLALGLALSLWVVSQITQSMIIDVNSYIIGLAGIPLFITMMVLMATYIPTSKITKKEPSEGLRQS